MNANLADYQVPVNGDVGEIDVAAIDILDPRLDSLGARVIAKSGLPESEQLSQMRCFMPRLSVFVTCSLRQTS